jgi:hypothetical protein
MKRSLWLSLLLAGCTSGQVAGTAPPPPSSLKPLPVATAEPPAEYRPPGIAVRPLTRRSADRPVVIFQPPTPESDARWRGEVVPDRQERATGVAEYTEYPR